MQLTIHVFIFNIFHIDFADFRRSSKATLRRAIDDYTAQGEGELSFEEGSFIKEINQVGHQFKFIVKFDIHIDKQFAVQ